MVNNINANTESKSRNILTKERLVQSNHRQNLLKRSLQMIGINSCLNCNY